MVEQQLSYQDKVEEFMDYSASVIKVSEVERLFGYKIKLKNFQDSELDYVFLKEKDPKALAEDVILENHTFHYLQALVVKEEGVPVLAIFDRHRIDQGRFDRAFNHAIASLHPEDATPFWRMGKKDVIITNGVPQDDGDYHQAAFSTAKDQRTTITVDKGEDIDHILNYGTSVIYKVRVSKGRLTKGN